MNDKWNRRFLQLAQTVGSWSKDPSTRVGAVIIDDLRRVLGLGYNGFPRGVHDDAGRYEERVVKYKLIVHAEANAILNARGSVAGATLYCTKFPCSDCAKLIVQAGIGEIVSPVPTQSRPEAPWIEDAAYSRKMFEEVGVVITQISEVG